MSKWLERELRKREYVIANGVDVPAVVDSSTKYLCPRCKEVLCDETSILEPKEKRPEVILKCSTCGQKLEWPKFIKDHIFRS